MDMRLPTFISTAMLALGLASPAAAVNPCGPIPPDARIEAVDPARIHTWPGRTAVGSRTYAKAAGFANGLYLSPFTQGPVVAFVQVTLTMRRESDGSVQRRYLALGDGSGAVYAAQELAVAAGGAYLGGSDPDMAYWGMTLRVTSPDLYVGLWRDGTSPGEIVVAESITVEQPDVCRPDRYAAPATYWMGYPNSSGRYDGELTIEWQIPSLAPPCDCDRRKGRRDRRGRDRDED